MSMKHFGLVIFCKKYFQELICSIIELVKSRTLCQRSINLLWEIIRKLWKIKTLNLRVDPFFKDLGVSIAKFETSMKVCRFWSRKNLNSRELSHFSGPEHMFIVVAYIFQSLKYFCKCQAETVDFAEISMTNHAEPCTQTYFICDFGRFSKN